MTAYTGVINGDALLDFYVQDGWSSSITNNVMPAPSNTYAHTDYLGLVASAASGDVSFEIVSLSSNNYMSTHGVGVASGDAPTDGAGVGFDWFERVHINPASIAAGAIVSDQSYIVEIHNAYRSSKKELSSVTNNIGAGVSLPSLPSLPDDLDALTTQNVSILIDKEGAATISGTIDFAIDNGQLLKVAITGDRVVMIPWVALDRMTEGVHWKTDVLRAYGKEQRRALRSTPSRSITMRALVKDGDRANMEGRLENQEQQFLVPLWWDLTEVGVITAGDLSISVDTTNGEYQVGAQVFVYQSSALFEAKIISAVNDSSIDLADVIENTYTAAIVAPAFTGYATSTSITRSAKDINIASLSFDLVNNYDVASPSTTQHRSIDVLTDPSIIAKPVSVKISQSQSSIDNGISGFKPYAKESRTRFVDDHAWIKSNKADEYAMKQWIYSRKGKQKSFFYPTWGKDYTLIAIVLSGATTIDVDECRQSPDFDIMVVLTDGTIFYRQVTGKAEISGGYRLNVDSSFGQELNSGNVDRISLMRLSRHASDSVEINHSLPSIATANIAVTTI